MNKIILTLVMLIANIDLVFSECADTGNRKGMGNIDSASLVLGLDPNAPVNTLTEMEEKLGWELLFDGTSSSMRDNWKGHKNPTLGSGWQINSDAMHMSTPSGDAETKESWTNFVLATDWRIWECGNSGIFVRGDPNYGNSAFGTTMEYQILDNTCHGDRAVQQTCASAVYGVIQPTRDGQPTSLYWDASNPEYEDQPFEGKKVTKWNKTFIKSNGVFHDTWLNGIRVGNYEIGNATWDSMRTISRTQWLDASEARNPDWGEIRKGVIVFQDHTDKNWYRNVKIKPLPEDGSATLCDYYPGSPECEDSENPVHRENYCMIYENTENACAVNTVRYEITNRGNAIGIGDYNIRFEGTGYHEFVLYDLKGNAIKSFSGNGSNTHSINSIKQGIYFLKGNFVDNKGRQQSVSQRVDIF